MKHKSPKKNSISRFVSLSLLIISSLSILATGYFWISSDLELFNLETEKLRQDYIDSQKERIRDEVLRAVEYIEYKKAQTEMRLKESIGERVYEAHSIAMNLYQQHHKHKSLAEIKQIVKDALRPIRYNHGRGYFFAFNLEGVETLFPVRPEMEGKNMHSVTGAKGEHVVPDMLNLVKKNGEGFYTYTWTKPRTQGFFPKIAFVKIIKPLNWVIGSGEYLDDVEKDIQQEVLNRIEKIRFGADDYLFAAQYDGISLTGPQKGKYVYNITDSNGLKIVQELIRVAQKGGGYVEYVLPEFEGNRGGRKISFATGIKDWEWYIGSGVYVDEIETVIAANQKKLQKQIEGHVLKIFLVLLTLALLVLILNKIVSDRIKRNFKSFTAFFAEASSKMAKINEDSLNFSEFSELAESANHMVNQRNQADKALRESQQRLKSILDSVNPGILVIKPETHAITDANQAARHMLGAPEEKIIGRSCQEFLETEGNAPCPITSLGIGVAQRECALIKVDGTRVPILKACKMANIGGEALIIESFLDISAQKKLEEQLRHVQKMEALGTLSGGIAHDFNNILSIIIGNAELACEDLPEENPTKDYVKEIKTASLRAKGVVQQLLSFSRRVEENHEPINIVPVVKEAISLLQSTLPSTIEFKQSFPDKPFNILADATQIHQVIINLCSNAAHAMTNEGGEIRVTLENRPQTSRIPDPELDLPPGDHLMLAISDTGTGIDPEHMSRIFEPYFTTKEAGKGSGIGLSIVHGIVTRHRGKIRMSSKPGCTTFEIFFPAVELAEGKHEEKNAILPKGNGKILWVDDEIAVASVGREVLTRLGYAVMVETSPLEALKKIKEQPNSFDMVISDMAMPKMTGAKLIAEMKKLRPDLPTILCTGYNDMITEELQKELGVNRFFLKPVDRKELAIAVSEILKDRGNDCLRNQDHNTADSGNSA